MRLLHRDHIEFALSNLQIQISVFTYLYYTVSLTRNYERPVFCCEGNREKALLFREFSMIKTCSEIKNLTAHTRATPKYVARNRLLTTFSSGRASAI